MGSYKDWLWKEIQRVMFRKQAATGYTIVVSPLLKKFTSRYRKNVLPCLVCREERQGQKGWEQITGRYVGASDITYAESTDHLRTPASLNLLTSMLQTKAPKVLLPLSSWTQKKLIPFHLQGRRCHQTLLSPLSKPPRCYWVFSGASWWSVWKKYLKYHLLEVTSLRAMCDGRKVTKGRDQELGSGRGAGWASSCSHCVAGNTGNDPHERESVHSALTHPCCPQLSTGLHTLPGRQHEHVINLHLRPKASQSSSGISEWARWQRWEHLSLTEGKLPHTPSKVYFYQGNFNWHFK